MNQNQGGRKFCYGMQTSFKVKTQLSKCKDEIREDVTEADAWIVNGADGLWS